ncbi:hypothetical protein RB595_006818 [Gaeumannomyces hyphopodioides]
MKTTGFLAFAGLAAVGSAHFTWDKIAVAGKQVGGDNEYVRKHDNYYLPIKFNKTPEGSITPNDAGFACNKNAKPAPNVLKVKANDMVSLNLGFGAKRMEHPGSVQVYVSPVSNAKADDGKDWYKIHQGLICKQGNAESLRSTAWCMWGEGGISTAIPETLPNGQYLMRAEQISLHGAHDGQAEFYVACAQIEVTGNTATSIQGTAVQFPGAYKSTDKAVNFSVWGRATSFDVIPGPDVIPGGTIRGSANGAGGDKTVKVAASGAGGGSATTPSTPATTSTPANNNNDNNKNGNNNQQKGKSTSPKAAAASPAPSAKPSGKPDCNKKRDLRARRAAIAAAQQ